MFDKATIDLLFEAAMTLGLEPEILSGYGLMTIQVHGKTEYVFHSTSVLNSQLSSYLANNKHATRLIMERSGLPNIPYVLPASMDEALRFLGEHKVIVAKPTLGKHSEGAFVAETVEDLQKVDITTHILEKFLPGREERYLLLNGEVLAVHRKQYDGPINNPETVRRVAYTKDRWNQQNLLLAKRAVKALGLNFAAVDFIITEDEQPYILEVNAAPGLSRFAYPDEGPGIAIGMIFLQATLEAITA